MTSAVVFAYHNVGARCLRVLLAHGIDVPLVVTHDDDPAETLWFERVADVAARPRHPRGSRRTTPTPRTSSRALRALAPDFLFSFYYRRMLSPALLAIPARGALNMHGSLLPKYRGRAPVNWAVLHGERETGASLHYMAAKPDAGDLVAQTAVPILPDDTAREVFDKVTVAAEMHARPRAARARRRNGAAHAARPCRGLATSAAASPRTAASTGRRTRRASTTSCARWRRRIPARSRRRRPAGARPAHARARRRGSARKRRRSRSPTIALVAHCGGGGTLAILELEVDGVRTSPSGVRRAIRRESRFTLARGRR